MSRYEVLDWFLLRTAFLSHEELAPYVTSKASVLKALENPYIREAIASTSPSLYAQISGAQSEIPEHLVEALFNCLWRMTYRSVPFGSFAGVSLGTIGNVSVPLTLSPKNEYFRTFIPVTSKKNGKTKILLNPSLVFENEVAKFLTEAQVSGEKKKFQYSYILLPKKLIMKLKSGPESLPDKVIDYLLKLGILWEKPVTGNKKAAPLESFSDSFSHSGSRNSENFKIELFKPLANGSFGRSDTGTILEASLFTLAAFPGQKNKIDSLKSEFFRKYEYQEVSLLELLGPDNSIGKKFFRSLEESPELYPSDDREELLYNFLSEPEVTEYGILKIDHNKQQKLLKLGSEQFLGPDTFVISLGKSQERFIIKDIRSPAIGHFSRYLHLDKNLKQKAQELVTREENLFPDAVFAEVLHKGEYQLVENISPQIDLYKMSLPVTTTAEDSKRESIDLSDLYVFMDYDTLHLRSRSLNKIVKPVMTSLHNFERDSHPIYQFLAFLQYQNFPSSAAWSWGKLRRLPFLPRVEFKNVILSPAMWNFSEEFIQSLKKIPSLAELRKKLKEKGLPSWVELHGPPVNLIFNIENDLSLKSLRKFLKPETTTFREIIRPEGVSSTEGNFSHDIIIPFVRNSEPGNFVNYHLLKKKDPPERETTFTPGSHWTYLQLFLNKSSADFVTAQELKALSRKLKLPWFFLKYSDSEFHLRIRSQGKDGKTLIRFAENLVKRRKISHFEIKTYRREIERYGGITGCKLFENLSYADSLATISSIDLFLEAKIPKLEFWLLASTISALSYIQSFNLSQDEIASFLNEGRTVDSSDAKHGEAQKILNKIKKAYLTDSFEENSLFQNLSLHYEKRAEMQKMDFKKLDRNFKNNRIFISRKAYLRSLIHLSLIRLDLDLTSQLEGKIIKTIREILTLKGKRC